MVILFRSCNAVRVCVCVYKLMQVVVGNLSSIFCFERICTVTTTSLFLVVCALLNLIRKEIKLQTWIV